MAEIILQQSLLGQTVLLLFYSRMHILHGVFALLFFMYAEEYKHVYLQILLPIWLCNEVVF